MTPDDAVKDTLLRLLRSDGASFSTLMELAGLDPKRNLRRADLAGIDFSGSDLTGYDFSGAILTGASFRGARVEDATFDGADLTDAVWPPGFTPRPAHRLEPAQMQIAPFQLAVVEALSAALDLQPDRRAIAVLPPGTGASAILAETLRRASVSGSLRSALVLTETVAERERLAHLLRTVGLQAPGGDKDLAASNGPRAGAVWAETFGNFSRYVQESGDLRAAGAITFDCSHVAFTSLPHRRRGDIAEVARQRAAPAMLGFSQLPIGEGPEKRLASARLREVFPAVTISYSYREAIEAHVLQPSTVVVKSPILDRVRQRAGDPAARAEDATDIIAHDVVDELAALPPAVPALVVAPDVDNVEALSDAIADALRWRTDIEPPRTVAPLSSRHKRMTHFSRQEGISGMVVVMTPAMLEGFDTREVGLVALTGRLPERHLGRLLFPPARHPPLRLLDYGGALAGRLHGAVADLLGPTPR